MALKSVCWCHNLGRKRVSFDPTCAKKNPEWNQHWLRKCFGTQQVPRHYGRETRICVCQPGPWFNIKMSSYQYRKSHCGDLTTSYLHNEIFYTGKTSLYWIRDQDVIGSVPRRYLNQCSLNTNWAPRNIFEWNCDQNTAIFVQEHALENVVCKWQPFYPCLNVLKIEIWQIEVTEG